MQFTWDPQKAIENIRKHGISFDEACEVFDDCDALTMFDPDSSTLNEDRFIILGLSSILNLLVVCHCYRDKDTTIRIISARMATIREITSYNRRRFNA